MAHGALGGPKSNWKKERHQGALSAQSPQHLTRLLQTNSAADEVSSVRSSPPAGGHSSGPPVMSDTEEVGQASAWDRTTAVVAAITAGILTALLLLVCYVIYRLRKNAAKRAPELYHTTSQTQPLKHAVSDHSQRFTNVYSTQSIQSLHSQRSVHSQHSVHSQRSMWESLPMLKTEQGAFHPILNPGGSANVGIPVVSASLMPQHTSRNSSGQSSPVLADRRSSTWSVQQSSEKEIRKAAEKLSNTFTATACTPRRVLKVGMLDSGHRLNPGGPNSGVQWQSLPPTSPGDSASTISAPSASLGRTSWTPHACASPHSAGPGLSAGPALPVWTTWNEMKFSQAGIQLQRPVHKQSSRRNTASSSPRDKNRDKKSSPRDKKSSHSSPKEQKAGQKAFDSIRRLKNMSGSSRDESSASSSSVAFVTISECVSYERPRDHMPPPDGSSSMPIAADKNSQSWPCANNPTKLSFADVKQKTKIHRGRRAEHSSDDDEQQPPTPRMMLKQMQDSLRSSNRSSCSSKHNSRATSKSNSLTKRPNSREKGTNGSKPRRSTRRGNQNRNSSGLATTEDATTESEAATHPFLDPTNSQSGTVLSKGNTQSIALSGSTAEGSGSTALTLKTHLTKDSHLADSDGGGYDIRTTTIDLAAAKDGQRYNRRRRRKKTPNASPEAWRALNEASYSSAASRGNQPAPNMLQAITRSGSNPVGNTTDATDSTYASDEGPSRRATIAAAATAALSTDPTRQKKAHTTNSSRSIAAAAAGAASVGAAAAALNPTSYDSESDAASHYKVSKPVINDNGDTCERALQTLHCKALQTVENIDIICSADTDTSHAYSGGQKPSGPARRCNSRLCVSTAGSTECVCPEYRTSVLTDGGVAIAATTSMKVRALAAAAAARAGPQPLSRTGRLQHSEAAPAKPETVSATADSPMSVVGELQGKQQQPAAGFSSGSALQSLSTVVHDQSMAPLRVESARRSSASWVSSVRSSQVGGMHAEKRDSQKPLAGIVSYALDPSDMSTGSPEGPAAVSNSSMELSGAASRPQQSPRRWQGAAPKERSELTSPAAKLETIDSTMNPETGEKRDKRSNSVSSTLNHTLSPSAARRSNANSLRYGSSGSIQSARGDTDCSSVRHATTESSIEPSDSMVQNSLRASKALWADLSSAYPGSDSSHSQGPPPRATLACYLAGMRSESTGTVGSSDADLPRSLGGPPTSNQNSSTRSSSHASHSITLPAAPIDSLPLYFAHSSASRRRSSSGTSTTSATPAPPPLPLKTVPCPAPRPRPNSNGLVSRARAVEPNDAQQTHQQRPAMREKELTDGLVSLGVDKGSKIGVFVSSRDREGSEGSSPSSVDSSGPQQTRQYNEEILPGSLSWYCDAAATKKQGAGSGHAATVCVPDSSTRDNFTPPASAHTVTCAAAYDSQTAPDSIGCWIQNGQPDAEQADDNGQQAQDAAGARSDHANVGRPPEEISRADKISIQAVAQQLDKFSQMQLLMGKWELLDASDRHVGGQSVVQFAVCMDTSRRFAVKFFLDHHTFYAEAALYAAFFPELRTSPEIDAAARRVCIMHEEHAPIGATVNFVPRIEAVLDDSQGELVDARGSSLPPCIVMERGESLMEWAERTEPDLFTVLAVLSTIATVLADMHASGYVHSNIKPSNILWLPRQGMWAPVDFANASHIGAQTPVAIHTLGYAAPELAQACQRGDQLMKASTAADAWALGIVAFELLYGCPALKVATVGHNKVMEQLTGAALLPWEMKMGVMKYTKVFEKPVMQLLHRDPAQRLSVRAFQNKCSVILDSLLDDV